MPDFPTPVAYIWEWFCELQDSPDTVVTHQDILAFIQVSGQHLTPGEADFIRSLSKLYVNTITS